MKKRKIFVKTPSRTKVVYKNRRPSKARCANCGIDLQGIKALIASKMKNTPKTQKNVSRRYGGKLCSKCSRKLIIEEFKK